MNVDAPFQTRSNFSIVPIGADGSISLYTTGGGDLVVDLLGSFVPHRRHRGRGSVRPARRCRSACSTPAPRGALASGATVDVPWPTSIDRSQAAALVVTVTGTGATGPGWIQALPSDADGFGGPPRRSTSRPASPRPTPRSCRSTPADQRACRCSASCSTAARPTSSSTSSATSRRRPRRRRRRAGSSPWCRAGRSTRGRRPATSTPAHPSRSTPTRSPGAAVPPGATGVVWNLAALDAAAPGLRAGVGRRRCRSRTPRRSTGRRRARSARRR